MLSRRELVLILQEQRHLGDVLPSVELSGWMSNKVLQIPTLHTAGKEKRPH